MKLKLIWPKIVKDSNDLLKEQIKPTLKSTQILVNGVLFTYILASIISGVVDLVFFSGLSKSFYNIFAFSIPASIVMCLLSLVITSGKAWCAIKVEQIKALQNFLKNKGYVWCKNLNKPKRLWGLVHKLCAVTSIITTISLSIVSIGAGIRTMQQNINNMTKDAEQLIELNNSINSGVKEKRAAKKDNIMSTKTAQDSAKEEVNKYWTLLDEYQTKIRGIRANEGLADEAKSEQIAKIKKEAVGSLPVVTSKNVEYISKPEFEKEFAKITKSNEIIDSSSVYEEAVAYDQSQIEVTIKAIADKDYKMPDGTVIQFIDDDGKVINTQLAIARLQNGVSAWQSDTGDVGESSKMFTLLATYFKVPEKAGGMGATEWMIMIIICFFGLLQEALIALLTPKVTIDRKTLFEYESYLPEFDEDDFMYYVYKKYLKKGVISQEDFYYKAEKCKSNKNIPDKLSSFIALTSKSEKENLKFEKNNKIKAENENAFIKTETTIEKPKTNYSNAVEKAIKEVEDIIKS